MSNPISKSVPRDVQLIAAALNTSTRPLSLANLADILDVESVAVKALLPAVQKQLETVGLGLSHGAEGYVLRLVDAVRVPLQAYFADHGQSLSPAALETLTLIAYAQPIAKAGIDEVRGVGSDASLKILLSRGLIATVSGSPLTQPEYRTTSQFLATVGADGLTDLPAVKGLSAGVKSDAA